MSKSPLETKLYFLMQQITDIHFELDHTEEIDYHFVDTQLVGAISNLEETREKLKQKSE